MWKEKEKARRCTTKHIKTSMGELVLQHCLKDGLPLAFHYALAAEGKDYPFDLRSLVHELGEEGAEFRQLADFRGAAMAAPRDLYNLIGQALKALDKKMGLEAYFAIPMLDRQARFSGVTFAKG